MDSDEIFERASADVRDHLLSDDYENRPAEIRLARFFGYDTRVGGEWSRNWREMTNRDRILLLRERLMNVIAIFETHMETESNNN
jgi:hypothetical protein